VNPTKLLFMATTVMAVSLVASILPAWAQSTTDSIVFFPAGNGATYSCTDGPPFVHNSDDPSMGNCTVEQVGPPTGMVCDAPTTITLVHDMEQLVVEGNLCRSSTEDAGGDVLGAYLPTA
jgi:hypothetical protein